MAQLYRHKKRDGHAVAVGCRLSLAVGFCAPTFLLYPAVRNLSSREAVSFAVCRVFPSCPSVDMADDSNKALRPVCSPPFRTIWRSCRVMACKTPPRRLNYCKTHTLIYCNKMNKNHKNNAIHSKLRGKHARRYKRIFSQLIDFKLDIKVMSHNRNYV